MFHCLGNKNFQVIFNVNQLRLYFSFETRQAENACRLKINDQT